MDRKEAIDRAQDHLQLILRSDDYSALHHIEDNRLYDVLSSLRDARNDFERHARDIKDSIDQSAPFVRGEAARWNSLGIMQSSGLGLEMAVAKFSALVDVAKGMLVDYYLAQ